MGPLPAHHTNFLWELGFLLKLLGFLNETTRAFSIKQNSRHTSTPEGHEIRARLTVGVQGKVGTPFTVLVSGPSVKWVHGKSERFQPVAA